jgi:hypothetical protein
MAAKMTLRIVLSALIVPFFLGVAWTVPYWDHPAVDKWAVINIACAYAVFLLLAAVSHFLIKATGRETATAYVGVMAIVSFVASFVLHLLSDRMYQDLYYLRTHVVMGGHTTWAGVLLQFWESVASAIYLASAMGLYWWLAVYSPDRARMRTVD